MLGGRLWWCLAVFFNDTRWCRYSYYFPSCGVCLPRCLVASPLGIWWCLLLNSVLSSDTRWYLSIFPSTSTPRAVCVSDEAMKRQESISTPPRDLRTRETSSTQSLLIGARRTSINKVVIAPIARQAQSLFVMIQQKGEGEVITRY